MNKPTRRIAATIIGLSLACAPAFAFAQSDASSSISSLQSQIQALLSELAGLRQQLMGAMGSTTMPGMMMGSSTMPHMGMPGGQGGQMMGSSTSGMMHQMMPWMSTSTSPAHPMQPPMHEMMGSSTPVGMNGGMNMHPMMPGMASSTPHQMWMQASSSQPQPYWIKFGPQNQNSPQQQNQTPPVGSGWHGSIPPWQSNQ